MACWEWGSGWAFRNGSKGVLDYFDKKGVRGLLRLVGIGVLGRRFEIVQKGGSGLRRLGLRFFGRGVRVGLEYGDCREFFFSGLFNGNLGEGFWDGSMLGDLSRGLLGEFCCGSGLGRCRGIFRGAFSGNFVVGLGWVRSRGSFDGVIRGILLWVLGWVGTGESSRKDLFGIFRE